jgi:hypothetical protein
LSEFYEFIQPRQQEANEIRQKQRDEYKVKLPFFSFKFDLFLSLKWKRVMQCDGTPDPTVLPEINTFITLWRDEQQRIDMEYTLKQTNLVLGLIKELNMVMNAIPNGSQELEKIPAYKKVSISLDKKEFF